MTPLPRTVAERYAAAIALVAVAGCFRIALQPLLGQSVPFLQFFPAIMVASWFGGYGPGVVATVLSAAAADYWSIPPVWSLAIEHSGDALSIALFVVIGLVIARLNESLRSGERKQREAADRLRVEYSALAELAQSQLAAIVESSEDAIVGTDFNRRVTSWNHSAERLFGYKAEEVIGKPFAMFIPADRGAEEDRALQRIRAGFRVEPFETTRRRKDGSIVDVSVTMSPIKSPSGEIVGVSKVTRDITERRRDERLREELLARERAALQEATAARDRLQFVAEISELLTASLDYQETLDRAVHVALPRLGDYCNVLVQDEYGRLRHVAWGHVVREKEPIVRELAERIFAMPSGAAVPAFGYQILRTGKRLVITHEALTNVAVDLEKLDPRVVELGAELRPYSYVGAPLMVRGRAVGVMSFGRTEQESARDYTDSEVELLDEFARRVSLAIENARLFREADQLNRLKDEFLATVSHELRTPLSAILGWARLLESGQLTPEKAARALGIIERNAQLQSKLVDDILDVARGMAGNVRLDVRPVDLAEIVQRGAEGIGFAAAEKQIDLKLDVPPGVIVSGDAARLQQVVSNLLSNALKFTPQGGRISVGVARLDGIAQLEVTDTGVGIPESFLPYVFDKFRQADASFTRQYGGLGLGLAIARHLVELHGGSVEARSQGAGRGATFVVRLPLAVAAQT